MVIGIPKKSTKKSTKNPKEAKGTKLDPQILNFCPMCHASIKFVKTGGVSHDSEALHCSKCGETFEIQAAEEKIDPSNYADTKNFELCPYCGEKTLIRDEPCGCNNCKHYFYIIESEPEDEDEYSDGKKTKQTVTKSSELERFIQYDPAGRGLRAVVVYAQYQVNKKDMIMVYFEGYAGGGDYHDGFAKFLQRDKYPKKPQPKDFQFFETIDAAGTKLEQTIAENLQDNAFGDVKAEADDEGAWVIAEDEIKAKFRNEGEGQFTYQTDHFSDKDFLAMLSIGWGLLTFWND